jgi:hypothetical protein
MSDLQNLTPANTYKALLQIGDYTDGISGDTGANALQVSDGAGNNTSLALSTNRVGIGNTSPSAELDVSGNVVADEYALDQTGSSSSAVAIHAPAANELAIRTNTAERVRIDSSGKVGIGTTSPVSPLEIQTDSDTLYSSGVSGNLLRLRNMKEDTASSHCGIDLFAGVATVSGHNPLARIHAVRENSSDGKCALTLATRSTSTISEAMRIDSSGQVGIGTTSPSAPLEVTSTTGGVIMPRMTTTQMNAISSPTDGEMIYNTTANKFYGRANGAWVALH